MEVLAPSLEGGCYNCLEKTVFSFLSIAATKMNGSMVRGVAVRVWSLETIYSRFRATSTIDLNPKSHTYFSTP